MCPLIGDGFDVPREVRDRVEFHWFHVPAGAALLLALLSPSPIWYVGHYYRGRMRACDGDDCGLCSVGVGRQVRYVMSAVELTTRVVGVVEVGAQIGRELADRAAGSRSLRGMIVDLSKSERSKHCPIDMCIIDEPTPAWVMSIEPLNLREVLEETWSRAEARRR